MFSTFFAGCENDIEKVKLVTDRTETPGETSNGLIILYSDSARIKVKVKTPTLDRYTGENPKTILPEGVFVEFYDSFQRISSTLSSKYAIRYDNEHKMEAKNDVVVINAKGERLNTEHLIWDENSARIFSDAAVTITTPDKVIMGDGFEANQDFTQYRIFKMKGTITLNNNEHAANP